MSAPGGKKKRMGSRRGVPSQRERSTAEDLHVTDSTSATQHQIPEEGTDSLNVLSKPDISPPETQHPPSPEMAMNRRKLGSRRNKGRLNMKGAETESYVESEEEVESKTRGNKTLETMQASQAIYLERQEEVSQGSKHDMSETPYYSEVNPMTANCPQDGKEILIPQIDAKSLQEENETKLERSDNLQSDIENAHVAGFSDLTSQDLLEGGGSIEGINSESESHVELAVLDSITPEVTTDKSSPGENIENESSVKHAMLSSPKEKLQTNEEVSDGPLSEDAELKEMQDMHQMDYSSDSMLRDATEHSVASSGAEIRDTDTSELSVKTYDFASEQDVLSLGGKEDEHPIKERYLETIEEKNEDYFIHGSSNTGSVDIKLGHMFENEGQIEDDIKLNDGPTAQQNKEGVLSEFEKSSLSPQALTSDINVQFDSQPQDNAVSVDEPSNTDFSLSGNRRKMGSSRRNKGRHRVKEPQEEDSENIRADEVLGKIKMSETMKHEESSQSTEFDTNQSVTHDSSMFSVSPPGSSSDVQNLIETNYLETNLEGLIPKSKNLHEDQEETDAKVSGESKETTLKCLDTFNTVLSEEFRAANLPEDAEEKAPEEEVKPTDIQEVCQINYTSESGIADATGNLEISTGSLIDQIEIIDAYQSVLMVESADHSSTKQEVSDPDDKQDEHQTDGLNLESLTQENADFPANDSKQIWNNNTEREDSALGHMFEAEGQDEDDMKRKAEPTVLQDKGVLSEFEKSSLSVQTMPSEISVPLDSQSQDNTVSVDEPSNTDFSLSGNRRKMGSSRRNKGRQRVKESQEADSDVQNLTEINYPETDLESLIPKTENVEEDTEQTDSKLFEKLMEETLEGLDTSDTVHSEEFRAAHYPEDAEKKAPEEEVNPTDIQDISQMDYTSESGINDATENTEIISECLMDQIEVLDTCQSEFMVKSADDSSTKHEVSDPDDKQDTESKESDECTELSQHTESPITPITTDINSPREQTDVECIVEQETFSSPKGALATIGEQHELFSLSEVSGAQHSEDVVNKLFEEQINAAQMEEIHQTDYTSAMESKSSLQTLKSETHLDSHPQSTEDETHTGPNPLGNRRKLGSSRRTKGRQHVKDSVLKTYNEPEEEVSENASGDEAPKMTNMSSPTETARQEELKGLKDNSTFVTTDIAENVSEHEGYSTVKTDLMQSPQATDREDDMQNILHHNDTDISRSCTADMLDQEEASQVQNTGALSCDQGPLREQVQVQQTDDVRETVGYVAIEELNTEAASLMDVQGPGQDEMGEKCEESTDEVVSLEQADVDASHESGFSMAVDANDDRQEKNHSDHSENLQVNFQHKRRKMGSTRKSQLKKKQEGDTDNKDEIKQSGFNTEASVRSLDKMDEMAFQNEYGQALVDTFNREQHEPCLSVYNEGHELQGNSADLQSTECNLIPGTDNSMVLLPEQSPSHNEEVINSVTFLKVTDIKDGERNVDVSLEPTQLDDFTSAEMQITSRRNRRSVNQLLPQDTENSANTGITGESSESFGESTPSTLIDEGRPEDVQVIQSQDSDEQNPDNMNEGARNSNVEMQSPNKNSAHRRRKMGSTRKNLGSRPRGEDLPQKEEVVDEATETETTAGVAATERGPGLLQLHAEHEDDGSKHRKEKVFETVEHSHVGESQLKPLAQQTVEENPVSQDQPAETENDLTPNDLPSTSPKEDTMSESVYGGRRRKMGSHRKPHGHQPQENQSITDVENENDASIKAEGSIKTAEQSRETPSRLDKISETEENEKKPSSNVNISREHAAPRENTPVQPYSGEIRLGQESQKTFSLAGNIREADLRPTGYNVVMVGDSSVGKTSFMKRAQSGKFSLDLPASVGLDSCTWTVVVDGKPLVLHIWDTAGQERFRSITRQIFHKAQAFLLMYDITSTQSFSAVSYWANCIQESAAENVIVLLLGNKCDHAQRQVKSHQGEVLAKEYNFEFMECSAATGENVIQSLETVARMLSQRIGTREEATALPKEQGQKKSSGCC